MSWLDIRDTWRMVNLLAQRATIVQGTKAANWNSGIATSGLAGADLVTIGTAGTWTRVSDPYLVLTGFNVAANITIRAYWSVAGVERLMLTGGWSPASDEVAWLTWWFGQGSTELFGTMRFEVHSDQAGDDGFVATYEYKTKDW